MPTAGLKIPLERTEGNNIRPRACSSSNKTNFFFFLGPKNWFKVCPDSTTTGAACSLKRGALGCTCCRLASRGFFLSFFNIFLGLVVLGVTFTFVGVTLTGAGPFGVVGLKLTLRSPRASRTESPGLLPLALAASILLAIPGRKPALWIVTPCLVAVSYTHLTLPTILLV